MNRSKRIEMAPPKGGVTLGTDSSDRADDPLFPELLYTLGSPAHPCQRWKQNTPGPEMLASKVLSLAQVYSRNLDGALSLEKPYHLRHRILGRNRDQHVYMVGLEMPF